MILRELVDCLHNDVKIILEDRNNEKCPGNVKRGGTCCDECDHFLKCFPECDPDNEAIDLAADEILHKYRRAFEELAK